MGRAKGQIGLGLDQPHLSAGNPRRPTSAPPGLPPGPRLRALDQNADHRMGL